MNDLEHEIRETLRRHENDAPSLDASDARPAAGRARRRQIVNVAGVGIGTLVVAVGLAVGLNTLERADRAPAVLDSPPPVTPTAWSPVHERGTSVVSGRPWHDPNDASVGWVDIRDLRSDGTNAGSWSLELAASPPRATGLEPGVLIAYGLVLDTTGDGVADYLIGIDNDAPERGDFHVWVSDLATGETDEQIGPPYGLPIEFAHPDEGFDRSMHFTFLTGSEPKDLKLKTVRFYAWASETRDGEVIAWDIAPDTGWIQRP